MITHQGWRILSEFWTDLPELVASLWVQTGLACLHSAFAAALGLVLSYPGSAFDWHLLNYNGQETRETTQGFRLGGAQSAMTPGGGD